MAASPTASRSSRSSVGSTKALAAASTPSAADTRRSDGGGDERRLSLWRRPLRSTAAVGRSAYRLVLLSLLPQGACRSGQRLRLHPTRQLPLAARRGQDQHLRILARQEPSFLLGLWFAAHRDRKSTRLN